MKLLEPGGVSSLSLWAPMLVILVHACLLMMSMMIVIFVMIMLMILMMVVAVMMTSPYGLLCLLSYNMVHTEDDDHCHDVDDDADVADSIVNANSCSFPYTVLHCTTLEYTAMHTMYSSLHFLYFAFWKVQN